MESNIKNWKREAGEDSTEPPRHRRIQYKELKAWSARSVCARRAAESNIKNWKDIVAIYKRNILVLEGIQYKELKVTIGSSARARSLVHFSRIQYKELKDILLRWDHAGDAPPRGIQYKELKVIAAPAVNVL